MRIHCTRNHPEYELPPPGTVMNKVALQKINAINSKYNVNLTNLSIPKKALPMVDLPSKNSDQVRYQVSHSIYRTDQIEMKPDLMSSDQLHTASHPSNLINTEHLNQDIKPSNLLNSM